MPVYNHFQGYQIDTDPQRLDINAIQDFLNNHSYWAAERKKEQIQKSIDNSFCFGVYTRDGQQVGFARVVTDWTTFAWLCDVYILASERGIGLGKWLINTIMNFHELKEVRRFMLVTRDAQELYRHYGGFTELENLSSCMERINKK
jgi:N-acetylglutamate synthase-like GNAT family acetyltransferase